MLEDKKSFDSDKLLDEVLMAEPSYTLPDNFAGMLAEKVGRRFSWEQYIKEFLIYLAVILGIIAVSAGMAFVWYEANWQEWLDFLMTNATWVAGINFLVVFILFADRVLLRYFLDKASPEK
jgi:hypothetical protein